LKNQLEVEKERVLERYKGKLKMEKLSPPLAVCTRCRAYTRAVQSINERCPNHVGGKRCKGVFRSALGKGDWKECSTCEATGRDGDGRCPPCEGFGWIFIRPLY